MDGLAGCELDHLSGDVDLLPPPAHQMHLDAAALVVVERPVAERVAIEVGTQLAIDAREQVEIELRGHARGIVIGGVEYLGVLDEIDADDEGCPRAQHAPGVPQERGRVLRLEVADGRAREKAGPRQAHDRAREPERARKVRGDWQDAQARPIMLQLPGLLPQHLGGNVDRHIGIDRRRRVQQDAHLASRAAAELDERGLRSEHACDVGVVLAQDRQLAARRVVLRKLGNLFEQLRAALVVEILRRQELLPRAEPRQHVAQKRIHRQRLSSGDIGLDRHAWPSGVRVRCQIV